MSKHFISVLGTGRYNNTVYYCGEGRYETPYIQEALLKIKLKEWESGDKITVFLVTATKAAIPVPC